MYDAIGLTGVFFLTQSLLCIRLISLELSGKRVDLREQFCETIRTSSKTVFLSKAEI